MNVANPAISAAASFWTTVSSTFLRRLRPVSISVRPSTTRITASDATAVQHVLHEDLRGRLVPERTRLRERQRHLLLFSSSSNLVLACLYTTCRYPGQTAWVVALRG